MTWFIISYRHLQFLNHVIIIKLGISTVVYMRPLLIWLSRLGTWLICPQKHFKLFCFPICLIMSVPSEDYSRSIRLYSSFSVLVYNEFTTTYTSIFNSKMITFISATMLSFLLLSCESTTDLLIMTVFSLPYENWFEWPFSSYKTVEFRNTIF